MTMEIVGLGFALLIACLVAYDASENSIPISGSEYRSSAPVWFLGNLLLMIIFLPWYLIKRASILNERSRPADKTKAYPVTNSVSQADELKKFKELLDAGVITQSEYDSKKRQLLG